MSIWDDYDITSDPTADGWGQGVDVGEGLTPADSKIEDMGNGQHAFAAAMGKGWHNLGQVYDTPKTAEQLLIGAYADYPVYLAEASTVVRDEQGNVIEVIEDDERRYICRDHPVTGKRQILGIGSPRYAGGDPVSNREAFVEFGDELIKVAEPNAATCGVLFGGKVAFMCWRLPKQITIAGIDTIDPWLLVLHSHDQSWPLTAAFTPLRNVCVNTCRYNLAHSRAKWTLRKTSGVRMAMDQVKTSLNNARTYAEEFENVANGLVAAKMSTNQFDQIITANFAPRGEPAEWKPRTRTTWEERRGSLMRLWSDADTQEAVRGTAWAALQAVGEFVDWNTKVNVKGWDDPNAYRFWRSISDDKSVADTKQRMLTSVLAFAGM